MTLRNKNNIFVNDKNESQERGDQMEFIYKWLEKRLFKKRHEVMRLQFEKIRLQQELDRLKEQQPER